MTPVESAPLAQGLHNYRMAAAEPPAERVFPQIGENHAKRITNNVRDE
jgi:hypothetical protein